MKEMESLQPGMRRMGMTALAIGIIAIALCIIGGFFNPRQFFHAWLLGFLYWLGIALGGMALVMIYHLTSGYWGLITRRLLESASRTLPLLALFVIPILFALPELYQWANPGAVAADRRLEAKQFYLTAAFFIIRTILYFAVWFTIAFYLNKWSAEQDVTDDPAVLRRLRRLSGPGAVLYGLTITFAAIDWVMSLEPHFYSTTFGFRFMTGQAVNALAFAIIATRMLSNLDPIARLIDKKRLRDLGNLLLACIMLWAYIGFTEFLIVWAGNIPDETSWYRHRFWAGWGMLAWFLIAFHFFVPFLLLLSRDVKHKIRLLAAIAAWLLFMRLVELFWMIEPSEHPTFFLHWMDILAPVGMGGIWLAVFLWQLGKRPLVPIGDPLLQDEVRA